MNIEELREYAATRILGLLRQMDVGRFEGVLQSIEVYRAENDTQRVIDWHPDTDRNQLWLVLEKFREWFDLLPSEPLGQLGGRSRVLTAFEQVLGERSFYLLHERCMSNPALALEAICKAHREANP